MRTFAVHDPPNSGVEVGTPPYNIRVSSLEYADDAALLDESVEKASHRLSAIASGSRTDTAMDISIPKTKAMHIHKQVRVSKSETHEIDALKLKISALTATDPSRKSTAFLSTVLDGACKTLRRHTLGCG